MHRQTPGGTRPAVSPSVGSEPGACAVVLLHFWAMFWNCLQCGLTSTKNLISYGWLFFSC